MRINRLDLLRFGKFTDRRIDLPSTEPDLHLIVGPNEAGKSTLRAALADLLFGIEARSPYNFLHQHKDLCIAAVLEGDGDRLTFRRLKRNRDSLRDADDCPLTEGRLTPFLGPVDRAFFERMFALDRRRLEEGGTQILEAKTEVGRMLFEASAGLASLGPLRQQLEAEADTLWGPRRKQTRAYSIALDAYEEAGRVLREATVRARDWQETRTRRDDATAALQAAIDRHLALETARARLDRVRRVAPHLRARSERLADRAAMGDVVSLPADAGARLDAAAVTLTAQATVVAQQQVLIARAEVEAERAVPDSAVLVRREAIVQLAGARERVRDHPADIEKRQAEVQQLRNDVAGIVRELGWSPAGEQELARRIPSRVVRAEIQEMLKRHAGLAESVRLSAEAHANALRDLASLDRELAALADRAVPAALLAAREQARTLGDGDARRGELQQALDAARRRCSAAMETLSPWTGDAASLRALRLPEAEAAQAQSQRDGEIGDRLRTLQAQARDAGQALEELRLSEAQIRRDRQPLTADEITAARADRDTLWADIREGRAAIAATADAYEGKVAGADDLADRRFLAASDVEKLEQVRARIEQWELKLRQYETERAALEAERRLLAGSWAAQLPDQLAGLAPASLITWMQRRRQALGEVDQLAAADTAFARFDDAVAAAVAALGAALATAGITSAAAGSLPGLLAQAETFVSDAEKDRARRQELARQRAKLIDQIAGLATTADKAAAAVAEWQRRWAELLAAVHLTPDLGTAAAAAALDLQTDLAKKLDQIDDLRRARIATMQRDLDAYSAQAQALAAQLAPELAGKDAETIAVALTHCLTEAEKAKERLQRAIADRAEAQKAMAEARALQQQAEATLQPLADRAGTCSIEDLRAAIVRSEQAMAIDAAVAEATRLIIDNGDGLSLADLAAAAAEEDLTTITVRLGEVEAEREAARAAREHCLLAKTAAETELAGIDGAATAAEAEARRQEALAAMAAATERYITVFVAARLLGWAIDRFRAEKQDPLLRCAGDIFRGLTLGSFAALTVDYDGDTPHLLGRRDNGSHVGVDGMSEGTRDQLYLALRLAAIELHLQKGRPLPFIADDLFVNFDDERAAAGFRALADLARRTQVIFLTHHQHLVEVAQQALGGQLPVTSL